MLRDGVNVHSDPSGCRRGLVEVLPGNRENVSGYSQEETSVTLDIVSHSSAQTQRLGARLGELLRGGELILLEGQLGTGKTTFTQGLAQGMGITEVISSPTFILLKEYAGQPLPVKSPDALPRKGPALYHFDLYRLDD